MIRISGKDVRCSEDKDEFIFVKIDTISYRNYNKLISINSQDFYFHQEQTYKNTLKQLFRIVNIKDIIE